MWIVCKKVILFGEEWDVPNCENQLIKVMLESIYTVLFVWLLELRALFASEPYVLYVFVLLNVIIK